MVCELVSPLDNEGKVECPLCHKRALTIEDGEKQPTVVYCFGIKTAEHQRDVWAWFKRQLPVSKVDPSYADDPQVKPQYTPQQKKTHTVRIWNRLWHETVRYTGPVVGTYLKARGIEEIPFDCTAIMPPAWFRDTKLLPMRANDYGMVMPIRDVKGNFQGMQTTFLDGTATRKRDAEFGPPRISLGNLKGNFIPLCELDYTQELDVLVIGEGIETTLSVMQDTEYPGVATGGKWNYDHVVPPRARRYIVLADCGAEADAQDLADRLLTLYPNCGVQIATPVPEPDSKKGYDWNDLVMDGASATDIVLAIELAPEAELSRKAQYGAAIEDLMKLDADGIALERKEVAKRFGVPIKDVMDAIKRRKQKREQIAGPSKPDVKKLRASAQDIIDCKDVLRLFVDDLRSFIAGETRNAKLIYLMSTTRLFEKPMNYALKGQSATGKSELRKCILRFFPPEVIFHFTMMSAKALYYLPDNLGLKHKIFVIAELPGIDTEQLDYMLRELMSEAKITFHVVAKNKDDQNETKTITIEGPVSVSVTTTRDIVNLENETRLMSLFPDDSKSQTKRVILKRAEIIKHGKKTEFDFQRWHDFQRWLAIKDPTVEVPYVESLARLMKGETVRQRRDFDQVMSCVMAHAFIHYEHRKENEHGHTVAIIKDYEVVYDLMADMLAVSSELKIGDKIAAALQAVLDLDEPARESGKDVGGVTIAKVRERLNVDRTTALRRLKTARDLGLVNNLEDRKGYEARYRLTDLVVTKHDKEQKKEVIVPVIAEVIPTVDALKKQIRVDKETAQMERRAKL
jgi:hypothetical protein